MFKEFCREVENLYINWTLWQRLFYRGTIEGVHPDELMQFTAPTLFAHVRWEMLRGATLDIGRLCGDPLDTAVRGAVRQNLTAERVFRRLSAKGEKYCLQQAERAMLAAESVARSQGMKELRNRVIAHHDMDMSDPALWPNVGPDDVNRAVVEIVHFRYWAFRSLGLQLGDIPGPRPEVTTRVERDADSLLALLPRERGRETTSLTR